MSVSFFLNVKTEKLKLFERNNENLFKASFSELRFITISLNIFSEFLIF